MELSSHISDFDFEGVYGTDIDHIARSLETSGSYDIPSKDILSESQASGHKIDRSVSNPWKSRYTLIALLHSSAIHLTVQTLGKPLQL